MPWLLLLALLSSSTQLKGGGSASSLNRLAETALRKQLGTVRTVRVLVDPGAKSGGDFDSFDVALDGFSADRLMGMADHSSTAQRNDDDRNTTGQASDDFPYETNDDSNGDWQPRRNSLDTGAISDILGNILGGSFGKTGSAGRIGRVRLRATNFTFQGARYDAMSLDMGEVRFNWSKALRGDFDVQSIAPGTLSLNLRGDQAARLLAPRLPSLSDVKVRFSGGRAFVGGKTSTYGVGVPFEVGARLSVQQNRVIANDFSASVSRLRLPSFVLDEVTRGVNPLYDFDPKQRWPLAINLSMAQATNDVLAMRGGIQWLGFNSRRKTRDNQSKRDDRRRDSDQRAPTEDSRYRLPENIFGDILGR